MSQTIARNLPQDRYIELDSVKIRYWQQGQGEPIILLHGSNSCVETWSFNINQLAQHYRVYAFDMVGTGRSDKPVADYSLDYQVGFLQCFMDALNITSPTLIGNSMGGAIALKFAIQFPERVNKLVLISSLGLGREINILARLLSTFPAIAYLSRPSRQGAKAVLTSCVYDAQSLPSEWIELSYEFFQLLGRKQATVSMIKTHFNFWGLRNEVLEPIMTQLKNIAAPTLIFWGKQDRVIPAKHAKIAAEQIPDSFVQIFDRCGHWAHVEYAAEFNQQTLKFLKQR
jgi:pimeloyl-ACP methyl ester carboxylesterase